MKSNRKLKELIEIYLLSKPIYFLFLQGIFVFITDIVNFCYVLTMLYRPSIIKCYDTVNFYFKKLIINVNCLRRLKCYKGEVYLQ